MVVINHRDCGAAKIAYGDEAVANLDAETATHRAALMAFREEASKRQPKLRVELGLMDLNGRVENFALPAFAARGPCPGPTRPPLQSAAGD